MSIKAFFPCYLSTILFSQMCERTLKYRLHEYGLQRQSPSYDEMKVRQRIMEEVNGPGCMSGYRSMWHTLRMEGFQVPRDTIWIDTSFRSIFFLLLFRKQNELCLSFSLIRLKDSNFAIFVSDFAWS